MVVGQILCYRQDCFENIIFLDTHGDSHFKISYRCLLQFGKNDRRPLFDEWFDECAYDRATHTKPCFKRYNWETYTTEVYPIKPNGTLGKAIREHKINKKSKLW